MIENDKNTTTERIADQPIGADYAQDLLEFLDTEFAKPEPLIKRMLGHVVPLFGLVKGLNVTKAAMIAPKVTVKYPEEKLPIADGFRGRHELLVSPDGEQICTCCNACVNICPIGCIELKFEKSESEKRKRDLLEYNVDLGKCLFCGLCQEVCPESCIILGKNYEYSDTGRGTGFLKVRMEDIQRRASDDEWANMQAIKAAKKKSPAKPAAKKQDAKPSVDLDKEKTVKESPEPEDENKEKPEEKTDGNDS
ncbi:NADH-quinone oxidoreductase subunit I [bacterium]|nr:NADH-quinone oxidoreductase subunit I [bacterium]